MKYDFLDTLVYYRHCPRQIWKPVPNTDGYYLVSNKGRVKSIAREVVRRDGSIAPIREKILSPTISGRGYLQVQLRSPDRRGSFYVHELVLEAFGWSRPSPKHQCRHFPDKNPANNNLWNLQWGSKTENAMDKDFHGTSQKGKIYNTGTGNGRAKLTEDDVREIRKLHSTGKWTFVDIGKKYKLHPSTVNDLVNYITWKNVQ